MRFDPERGRVFVEAPGSGPGHWAGAPGIWREGSDLFVTYRLRRPHPDRGLEMHVATLRGGRLETLVRIGKDDLAAESIERCALVHERDEWRLYVSYVAASDRKWRIDVLVAPFIETFDTRARVAVLHPDAIGLSAVKDPWLRHVDGVWHMFVSCGRATSDPRAHSTGDALSTGMMLSETGHATGRDGVVFTWDGIVFSPSGDGWDRATTRIGTAVRDQGGWLGFYDGGASIAENYEERCGLARSSDLLRWERVSADGPSVGTPRGAGGVRYVDATEAGDVFYEYTRADGAHELRGIVASASTPAAGSRRA